MSLVAGPGRGGGLKLDQLSAALELVVDKHAAYVESLDTRRDEFEYHSTEHLRVNGIYWGLTALNLLGKPGALPRQGVLEYIMSCFHDNGGFGAAPGHDPHMLSTVSAVQILTTIDAFPELEQSHRGIKRRIAVFIANLQQPNGNFAGDIWGETDTRFLYGALNAMSLLNMLPSQNHDQKPLIDVPAAIEYVKACQNFDGGFGVGPGAESHSGQIFTCVAALSITGELDSFMGEAGKDRLGAWLSERQLSSGGLNGRPEKLVDVCYSWWVMSSMAMLGRLHWVDKKKLTEFILKCQDPDRGGLADRPGDMVDVFHTHFGLAGLSLLQHPELIEIDPVYCMPKHIVDRVVHS